MTDLTVAEESGRDGMGSARSAVRLRHGLASERSTVLTSS